MRTAPVPVEGYEDRYEVTDEGDVYPLSSRWRPVKTKLKPWLVAGYPSVRLYDEAKNSKTVYIHRLVAAAFIGPIPDGMEVNHIDRNRENNLVSNLEFLAHDENVRHAVHHKDTPTRHNRSAVIGTHLETGEVVEFPSVTESGRHGFTASSISKCCLGGRNSHRGYSWKYANRGVNEAKTAGHSKAPKAVISIDQQSGAKEYYRSMAAAEKVGYSASAIHKCCNGKQSTHKGFKWEYTEARGKDKDYSPMEGQSKPVTCTYVKTGEKRKFPSISSAAKDGFEMTGVVQCCRGQQKTSHGYTWEYS